MQWDEVGVVRKITMKEWSLAKWKQLFLTIQMQDKPDHPPCKPPLQLLLDMPICWSSTFLMLECAETLKVNVNSFVHELAAAERDHNQRQKLMDLQLTNDEWMCVHVLLALLCKVEEAQQAFSSDCSPTIHLALPALEALHKAWHSQTSKLDYIDFWTGLEASTAKIEEYYKRSADSDVYIMAMCMRSIFFSV